MTQFGVYGLGRMGMNMARRLIKYDDKIVVFNRTLSKVDQMEKEGAIGSTSLEDFVQKLSTPRIVWMMLPSGAPANEAIIKLSEILQPNDILVDGGNTYYKDDLARYENLEAKGIHYVDAGVSGGIWGLEHGYCIMVGGRKEDFNLMEKYLVRLTGANGYLYCGPSGAGHFIKMIHNGIEYGVMEAYGEGFELLKASPYSESLNLGEVAHLWNNGSVVKSWLLELLADVLIKNPNLDNISGVVSDSGEGRWTVKEAVDFGVSADVITIALFKRFQSRQKELFSNKVLAALRNAFGGHQVFNNVDSAKTSDFGAGEISHSKGQD